MQDLSDSRIVKYLLGWTLYYQGERERAEALLETMSDDEGPLPGNARATLAAFRAARGASAEARALAERVASEAGLIHHGAYGLGTAYTQLREPTTALRWLSQAGPAFPAIHGTSATRCSIRFAVIRDSPTSCASSADRGRTRTQVCRGCR